MATAALGLAKAIKAMRDSQDYKAVFDLYTAHRFTYAGPDVLQETLHVVDVIASHRFDESDEVTPEEQIAGLVAAGEELNALILSAQGLLNDYLLEDGPSALHTTKALLRLLDSSEQRAAQGSWQAAKAQVSDAGPAVSGRAI